MEKLREFRNSIWRVPLISIIGGFLYFHAYLFLTTRFGTIGNGNQKELNDTVCLMISGGLLFAVLFLGWAFLLKGLTRKEIFVSSSVVVVYGIVLFAVQSISGMVTGSAALVFMRLFTPLQWTGFPSDIGIYLQNKYDISLPFLRYLDFFVPWLFLLFGKKEISSNKHKE